MGEYIKVSLHTGEPKTSSTAQTVKPSVVSWASATPEQIECITVGDDVFVRPDWDAYRMGQLDMLDAARDAVAALPDWSTFAEGLIYRDAALAAIDALRGEL